MKPKWRNGVLVNSTKVWKHWLKRIDKAKAEVVEIKVEMRSCDSREDIKQALYEASYSLTIARDKAREQIIDRF